MYYYSFLGSFMFTWIINKSVKGHRDAVVDEYHLSGQNLIYYPNI